MAERVFDRRGRRNWDNAVRVAEDGKLSERRAEERRSADRRQNQRRVLAADVSDPDFIENRVEDRRKGERRSGAPITTVRDLLGIRLGSAQTLAATATLRDAIDFLAASLTGLAVIGTETGGFIGVLSERDMLRILADRGPEVLTETVERYMVRGVWSCAPEDCPEAVLLLMSHHRIRYMPVLDDGRFVGMVSANDLLDYFAERLTAP